jgi:phosphoribosylamine--glycine ligase
MEVLIVGSGAREQALAQKLAGSPDVDKLFIAEGNAGTEFIDKAENVAIAPTEIEKLAKFAVQNNIGLTVVGLDDALADGIVDRFHEDDLPIFGPTKQQARLEWDRDYAKRFAGKSDVPIGSSETFGNADEARAYAQSRHWPIFVKQNGQAQGKGAKRCDDIRAVDELLQELGSGYFKSGKRVVVEDYVSGPEASHHAFCDGVTHLSIPFLVRDHKTLTADSKSPMTGGMGVVGPLGYTMREVDALGDRFVAPVVRELGFKGLLFSGLKGIKGFERNLEWNVRFGDPETQVFMRLLKSDLLPILIACVEGKLGDLDAPQWHTDRSVASIVMAAPGYPNNACEGCRHRGHRRSYK